MQLTKMASRTFFLMSSRFRFFSLKAANQKTHHTEMQLYD